MVNTDEIRRRIRAARAIGGFSSAASLAHEIDERGLSDKTLRKIESGERPNIEERELRAIGRACNVPYAFFLMDFAELEAIEHVWPTQADLEALGVEEGRVILTALQLLDEQASRMRDMRAVGETPEGRTIYLETAGAQLADSASIAAVVGPMIQEAVDNITADLRTKVADLEQQVLNQQREQGRDELEQELEEVAQRREQQRGSSAEAKPSPRRRGQAQ